VTKLATGEPADPSWRVTLHFHPDRLAAGTPILERMARDGVYRSQFETGTSNGGLSTLIALAEKDDKDPGVIGTASRTGRYHEQHLKRVWHYLARFGTPEYGRNLLWATSKHC